MAFKGAIKAQKKMNDVERAIKQASDDIRTPEKMKGFGKFAAEMIKLRTRLGSGVARDGAEKSKLKPLAESTKDQRGYMQDRGELNKRTNPGKSNLTRTGQLLDSISAKSASRSKVTIGPSGARTGDGKRKLTNEEVGRYVEKGGRPFNNLSKTEIKRTKDLIAKEMKKAIRARLTKLKK